MKITEEMYREALRERNGSERQEKIFQSCIGIAGLGGLGSAIALSLARAGVGKLVLADFDKVDLTNVHRQQYTLEDVGKFKTEALKRHLEEVNPFGCYEFHCVRLDQKNIKEIFKECKIICEAFDSPVEKAMLTETVLAEMRDTWLIGGNGMAGFESANSIRTIHPMSRLFLCGDQTRGIENGEGLTAPRVLVCAGHEALTALRIILEENEI